MTAITRPFDEDSYPALPEALLEVLALARELANAGTHLRTMTVAERLDITRNAAYKRIRRLRELGLQIGIVQSHEDLIRFHRLSRLDVDLHDARRVERLYEKVLGARADRLLHEGLLAEGAAHDDPRLRVALEDLADGVDAVHLGHDDVHRHEIRTELHVALDGLRAGVGLAGDLHAVLDEDLGDHPPHEDRVVHDEYSEFHWLLLSL